VRPEGLGKLNKITSLAIEPAMRLKSIPEVRILEAE
jgi:hypothetical protein